MGRSVYTSFKYVKFQTQESPCSLSFISERQQRTFTCPPTQAWIDAYVLSLDASTHVCTLPLCGQNRMHTQPYSLTALHHCDITILQYFNVIILQHYNTSTLQSCVSQAKTVNEWSERHDFVPHPRKYTPLERDYGNETDLFDGDAVKDNRYVRTYTYTCMCVCVCARVCFCLCVRVCISVYETHAVLIRRQHAHIYMHACMHSVTHTPRVFCRRRCRSWSS